MKKKSDEIIRVADAINKVLKENEVAISNSHAIKRLESLVAQMPYGSGYAAIKAREILSYAIIYYSDRKHWDRPFGANGLMARMKDNAKRVRNEAKVYVSQSESMLKLPTEGQ